jgi:tRNA nucleotidyltransferase/poly(A) polymerase
MAFSFKEYRKLREAADGNSDSDKGSDESHKDLHSNITLGDGNDFPPFVVSDRKGNREHGGQNANLAPIVRAFKDGATWGATKQKEDGALKDVKISGKKLYLVGGSVRDIIMGRTPKDLDITTDATPEEIEKILVQNGFVQRDGPPKEDEHQERRQKQQGYNGPSPQDAHSKSFFHLGKDERGEPFVYGVVVNGEMYELATFRKDHKGGDNTKLNQVQHGTHADDAARRDLTMNQMYIQLDNPDGENKKLIDHHGGIHDIKAGHVKFVGNAKDRLEEDPIRALRAIRFAHRFGKGKDSISGDQHKALSDILPEIKRRVELPDGDPKKLAHERIQAELKKGMSYKDVDPSKYLKSLEEFGLLDVAFPGLNKSTDFPDEMQGFHSSPHHMLAHMLKGNQDLGGLSKSLNDLKYSNEDSDKIGHLIKMLRFNSDTVEPDDLEQLMKSHLKSGVSNRNVSDWMTKVGGRPPHEADALFQHFGAPRVKVAHAGGSGPFDDLMNPVTGKPNPMTAHMIGGRKRGMEHQNFHKLLQGLAPKKEM